MTPDRKTAIRKLLGELTVDFIDTQQYFEDLEPQGLYDTALRGKLLALVSYLKLIGRDDLSASVEQFLPLHGNAFEALTFINDHVTPEVMSVLEPASVEGMEKKERLSDRDLMLQAIELSRKCISEPDKVSPKVGAVIARDGVILGTAYRGEYATGDHAEFTLMEMKLQKEVLAGATLYTTLEPCTSRGPDKVPCAARTIERRVGKVFIGALDRNPRIRGKGELQLLDAGIQVARFDPDLIPVIEEMNRDFLRVFRKRRKRSTAETKDPVEAGQLGPNGFRIGYTESGDKVEWIPDEEFPGELWPMLLRRNDKDILAAYEEFADKVKWNRFKIQIEKAESSTEPLTPDQRSIVDLHKRLSADIEEKYGRENLGWDDFEWGFLQGKMSALAWVTGSEWEESLDM
jgi:pyrimidine deaminase RibD-like protein